MLHHLLEDITRFGCALQYETESSEQFNKFIREHLFMTNRLYTSRDVAIRFGQQFICRQLFKGLSFVYVERKKNRSNVWYETVYRGESGPGIKAFQVNHPKFNFHFFGARENISDNYEILKSKVVPGLTGLFETNYGLMLGKVESDEDNNLFLRNYVLVENFLVGTSWLPGVEADASGNVHIKPCVVIPVLDTFRCKEVMDFGFPVEGNDNTLLVNISKFGTYWSLICNFNSFL
ncbi:hypothetical protein BD770DRAFT_385080 [Pilaira anomala]|nr:hypothetical protein BD770DRAFT_385080 [Pilaira anomala]